MAIVRHKYPELDVYEDALAGMGLEFRVALMPGFSLRAGGIGGIFSVYYLGWGGNNAGGDLGELILALMRFWRRTLIFAGGRAGIRWTRRRGDPLL
ncbi:hypothetical protein CVT26_003955 [Gymnopilus dilepis]|uniref:Uncharacterized protein n=1 Tax=Gymnopilus dilepis TaxID=231916 RepID=A0A409W268_9AGAR|nr:hypothetical protein CVT26_003955 [Gymnopilus dilepis]